MRKALVVVAMVAASFAGGAAVNGPGLAWLRGVLGLNPAPIEPLDPAAPGLAPPVVEAAEESPGDEPSARPRPARRRGPGPARDEAPPAAEPEAAGPADEPPPAPAAEGAGRPEPEPEPEPEPARSAPTRPSGEPVASRRPPDSDDSPPPLAPPMTPEPAPSPATAEAPPAEGASRAVEPGWGDAPGSAPASAVLPAPRRPPGRVDPAVSPASLPAPAAEVASSRPADGPAPPAPSPPASPTAWAALRGRMTALGVSRYWIEGEPGGPSRFRCVVPLAGRGSVAQQFEAEADDVLAAAEAALRRIDLWRATEPRP